MDISEAGVVVPHHIACVVVDGADGWALIKELTSGPMDSAWIGHVSGTAAGSTDAATFQQGVV